MELKRLSLLEGARNARGTTVIIDVLRAFTTAAFIMANGAKEIRPVGTIEEALTLRRENPGWLISGEVHGHKVPGFDFGNSPYELIDIDFTGKTVIHRTSSGVQGIIAASYAEDIILGSFVMVESILEYILKKKPETVSLVAMGWEGKVIAIEDELCADYLEARLRGDKLEFESIKQKIMNSPSVAKFFDKEQEHFKKGDLDLAMSIDMFDFVLRVRRGLPLIIEKVQQNI